VRGVGNGKRGRGKESGRGRAGHAPHFLSPSLQSTWPVYLLICAQAKVGPGGVSEPRQTVRVHSEGRRLCLSLRRFPLSPCGPRVRCGGLRAETPPYRATKRRRKVKEGRRRGAKQSRVCRGPCACAFGSCLLWDCACGGHNGETDSTRMCVCVCVCVWRRA